MADEVKPTIVGHPFDDKTLPFGTALFLVLMDANREYEQKLEGPYYVKHRIQHEVRRVREFLFFRGYREPVGACITQHNPDRSKAMSDTGEQTRAIPNKITEQMQQAANSIATDLGKEARINAAAAVFGVLAWLSTRDVELKIGASNECSILAEIADRFCKANQLGAPINMNLVKHPLPLTQEQA